MSTKGTLGNGPDSAESLIGGSADNKIPLLLEGCENLSGITVQTKHQRSPNDLSRVSP